MHELLYRSPDLARVDFGAYLNRLARDLFSFYGIRESDVHLAIDVKNANLEINQALPCGLLVNEVVTNCLKHAFPGGRTGDVRITLECSEDNCFLTVEDNGIGLPEGFDWKEADSLGLQLVRVLTNQLGGTVHLDGSRGTRFEISFSVAVDGGGDART